MMSVIEGENNDISVLVLSNGNVAIRGHARDGGSVIEIDERTPAEARALANDIESQRGVWAICHAFIRGTAVEQFAAVLHRAADEAEGRN